MSEGEGTGQAEGKNNTTLFVIAGLVVIALIVLGIALLTNDDDDESTTSTGATTTVVAPSPEVELLQACLTELGHYSGPVDGIYGAATRDAVSEFQLESELAPDGIVGQDTLTALEASGCGDTPSTTVTTTPSSPTTSGGTPTTEASTTTAAS